jgi:low temperature requirement protein LtrA
MIDHEHGRGLLRSGRDHAVTPTELFFDLVYVFAITQLSHLLLEHLTIRGALQTGLLMLAVWWAWSFTAWATNWFDPNQRPVRAMLIAAMAASLIMSSVLPDAFGERGLFFAVAYVAMQAGRSLFIVAWTRGSLTLHRNYQRILAWQIASGIFWIAGGLTRDGTRELLWISAVIVDVAGPATGFYTPGLGRSSTHDWNISGAHIAERSQLFLIIALGESILMTGATFSELEIDAVTLAAFVVAFLGSVALWWIYFDRGAEASEQAIAHSSDPGRTGRSAFTYLHLPMVAGIVVMAVGDELAIAHPLDLASPALLATVLGGPALFLAGHTLFKRVVFGAWSVSRMLAIVVLGLFAVVGRAFPALAIATATVIVTAAVSFLDGRVPHPAPAGSSA